MTARQITLTNGLITLVDEADYDALAKYQWRHMRSSDGKGSGYAVRHPAGSARGTLVWMHRELAQPLDGQVVDHVNGDGLDNQRHNLRTASHAQNMRNRRQVGPTGYKGLCYRPTIDVYDVQIRVNGRSIRVGSFRNPIVAAVAYDAAAREHHGEFARLNFSPDRDWILPSVPQGINGKPPSVRASRLRLGVSAGNEDQQPSEGA